MPSFDLQLTWFCSFSRPAVSLEKAMRTWVMSDYICLRTRTFWSGQHGGGKSPLSLYGFILISSAWISMRWRWIHSDSKKIPPTGSKENWHFRKVRKNPRDGSGATSSPVLSDPPRPSAGFTVVHWSTEDGVGEISDAIELIALSYRHSDLLPGPGELIRPPPPVSSIWLSEFINILCVYACILPT